MMKVFQIWMEGFSYGGDVVLASYVGQYIGFDFRDAVLRYYARNPSNVFDPVELTDYKCRLFPTEEEARAYCG